MYNTYIIKVKELLCVRCSTNEARNKFAETIGITTWEPVAIDERGRSVSMIVATEDYEHYQGKHDYKSIVKI